ncbi:SigE family RNA polymerase sigma factor [Catenulispora sp. MAP5-51]|uniref:SigE family RNA polymerase sigma factor n=1 Tax=unclassified Catenulispora TaxID=414885 RepID=UPI003515102E
MSIEAEFTAYAAARAQRLRDTAFLLCGDWHTAQDLTQTTLAKLYTAWKRVERSESVDAYARQVMLRTFLDSRRLKRSSERPTTQVPDIAAPADSDPALRLTLLSALAQLPLNRRAVLVLRFWEDQTVEATGAAMGLSASAVKSLTQRALADLRSALRDDDAMAELDFLLV